MTWSAVMVHGCSSTRAPRSRRLRTIDHLMPVSMATTRGPSVLPSRASSRIGSPGVTSRARSWPSIGGSAISHSMACVWSVWASNTPPRMAPLSRMWRTSARVSTPVSAGMPRSASQVSQPRGGAGGVVAVHALAHDHGARVHVGGLHVRRLDAVVAHHRVGEDDDLAAVAGVGDRLLVAGHGGVEHDLAPAVLECADEVAVEALAVLQQQVAGRRAHLTSPWTCLNSSPPALPSISNRAVSTRGGHRARVGHAPQADLAVQGRARADGVHRHVHLDARRPAARPRSGARTRGPRSRTSAPGRGRRGRTRRRRRRRTRSWAAARRRPGGGRPRRPWPPAPSGTAR